jgi:hypothetical protein
MSDWKDSVVLISREGSSKPYGTGFVFHRDSTGRSFILTCLHVVDELERAERKDGHDAARILAAGKPVEVYVRGDGILDLAVLAAKA